MNTYYHEIDTLCFQHQISSIAREMEFRIKELIDGSRAELEVVYKAASTRRPLESESQGVVIYRFSSFLALLQTFRDALTHAVGEGVDLSTLSRDVPHSDFLFKLRNAHVHDGYQPIALWVDGRYYFPVSFARRGQGGRSIKVDAPVCDIETLALQYAEVYCGRLAKILEDLPEVKKLKGLLRTYEWYQAATMHPALMKFAGFNISSRTDFDRNHDCKVGPLDMAVEQLRKTAGICTIRLRELENLPNIPYTV